MTANREASYALRVHHEEELLKRGLELLAQMRSDPSAWSLVRYLPQGEVQRDRKDANALQRLQLAWALQREFEATDGALLRFALAEEVKWRQEDPWQGIGETLEILATLTARERNTHDVWMLVRAKQANFDTQCGFDLQYAFAGGVAKTLAYVRSSDHPDRDAILELLLDDDGEPQFDEKAIEECLDRQLGKLRGSAEESSRMWFERAIAVGRLDIANAFLDERMANGPRDPQTMRSHVYDLESLERWQEASAIRKEGFACIDDTFERAGEACRIARLERAAKNPEEAQRWLRVAAELHVDNIDWRELGLGRSFVEECFHCAKALGADRGAEMFALGDRFAKVTPRLPLAALDAGAEAAEAIESPRRSHYKRQRDREASRLEKLLGK